MNERNDREALPLPLGLEPITAAVSDSLRALGEDALGVVQSVTEQLSPATATWGIGAWEALTGITPPKGASIEDRRAAILAQLCSRGTTNAAAIERLAVSLTGYGAAVEENFGNYSFSLTFLGDAPGFAALDLTLLYRAVEVIKPAHLRFIVNHVRWEDLAALTWAQLEARFPTWADLEAAVPVKGRA